MFFSDQLANMVVVKKKNRKKRVGPNFTDLNRACHKDPFPCPKDQPVSGHHVRPLEDDLSGCFLGISPDCPSSRRLGNMSFISL